MCSYGVLLCIWLSVLVFSYVLGVQKISTNTGVLISP